MKTFLALALVCLAARAFGETGVASWYGEEHRGKTMANGRPFDPDKLTCASWFYPFGTRLEVRHSDRSVIVTVTDRGPAKRLVRKENRIVDLSRAAFARLADTKLGLINVKLTPVYENHP